MLSKHALIQRGAAIALLVIVALVSFFSLSETLSSPDFHRASIEALDEKKVTVVELTTATAIGSAAVATFPGDATTPIANQIAQLSTYLMLVTGAIMLEKFLLTVTGLLAFKCLIPIACVLGILWLLLQVETLKRLAIRLAIFSLAICLVIPVSLRASDLFDETFHSSAAIDETIDTLEEPAPDKDTEKPGSFFSQIGDKITAGAAQLKEAAEEKLSAAIDVVATLLISNCAIPVLILLFFLWLTKAIFGLSLELPRKRTTTQSE